MNTPSTSLAGKSRIDPVGQVELLLNQVFLGVFQTVEARKRFGFSKISAQVSFDGLPGWYVWFSDRPGAYLLRALVNDNDDPLLFTLRALDCGEGFDSTGTPSAEGEKSIPASFYLVGRVGLCWSKNRRLLELQAASSERLRDYRVDGLTLRNSSGEPIEVVCPGGCDRNLPGWQLTHHLVDKLLLAVCFQQRIAPIAALVAARDGYANHLHAEQKVERRLEPGVSQLLLHIALAATPIDDPELSPATYAAATRQHLGGKPVACVVGHPADPEGRTRFINPNWWQAKKLPMEPAASCGCCHHDH